MKKLSQKARRAGITPVNRSCGTHITLNWKNARTDRFSEQRETARTYAIREAYDYFDGLSKPLQVVQGMTTSTHQFKEYQLLTEAKNNDAKQPEQSLAPVEQLTSKFAEDV